MSVINRLEVKYLNILRGVVILAASISLILAIAMGLIGGSNYLNIFGSKEKAKEVSSEDVIKILSPKSEDKKSQEEKTTPKNDKPTEDLYQKDYESIAEIMINFVRNTPSTCEKVNFIKDKLIDYLKRKTDFDNEEHKKLYVRGLRRDLPDILKSKVVLDRTKQVAPSSIAEDPNNQTNADPNNCPIKVARSVLDAYLELAYENIELAEQENDRENKAAAEKFATSTPQLYTAGGAFATFLILAFILILVKIERNIRELAERNKTS